MENRGGGGGGGGGVKPKYGDISFKISVIELIWDAQNESEYDKI